MRLIDADAFKNYIQNGLEDMRHFFKDNGKRAEKIIEGICEDIDEQPTIELPKWIPIKYHEITDEEREENGYPNDWVYYLDCEMPEDGQEILVTTKNGYVEKDVCCLEDGYSLDSGWDWREDVLAWMPLPEPWKGVNDGEDHE